MEKALYDTYLAILKEELVPAMGCTEPIAVAYAAALAARALGCPAEQAEVAASANIIKNVKSVVVPHTGGRRGIAAAAAAGIVAGDADKELEVLCAVTEDDLKKMADFLEKTPIHVERSGKPYLFDIQVRLFGGGHTAFAEIAGHHTNVIALQRDGEVLLQKEYVEQTSTQATDHTLLNVEQIVQFADEADLNDVKETLQRQIDCNTAIAKQGLEGHWGAEIGRILLRSYGDSVHNRAKAWAAAGSDARMNGCELPVVINSGSGNQGLTASLPVIIYARDMGASRELLFRALLVSNLVTSTSKLASGPSRPTVAPPVPAAVQARALHTSTAAAMTRSLTRWSTRWPSTPVWSAMVPRPAAPQRSLLPWKQACWECRCRCTTASLWAATVSCSRAWRTPSAT